MITFNGITRRFGSIPVLREVTFGLAPGRTLGLVGENGAGKSTLMNILGGNLQPDAGEMLLAGRPYAPGNPAEAARNGIAFIHQELNLFPNLTVAENMFLVAPPRHWGGLIDKKERRQRAAALLSQTGLEIAPDLPLDRLSTGERQLVEIAKAFGADARLIILDEPTTSLTQRESETLFSLMRRMRDRGISLIFISHILQDVLRLCDDIVVLRDGQVVGAGPRAEFSAERMVSLMVGRPIAATTITRQRTPDAQVVLEACRLSQRGVVKDVSLKLHRAEVLGVSGLMGAGRSELARLLFGLERCEEGEIILGGERIERLSPRQRIERGLAFLTENRREEGLCLEASVEANASLAALGAYASPVPFGTSAAANDKTEPSPTRRSFGFIDQTRLGRAVASLTATLKLKAASPQQPVKTLSGGNQQKVVLAKWLLAKPKVLILDEPTRGIDVGAKFEIHQLIAQLADGGTGILLISSELEELIALSDRILVMDRGTICDELARMEFDRERILRGALDSRAAARSAFPATAAPAHAKETRQL